MDLEEANRQLRLLAPATAAVEKEGEQEEGGRSLQSVGQSQEVTYEQLGRLEGQLVQLTEDNCQLRVGVVELPPRSLAAAGFRA